MKKKILQDSDSEDLSFLTQLKKKSRDNRAQWLCQCDCGGQKITTFHSLSSGAVRSCGCLRKEMIANQRLTEKVYKL